jgi:hypothetical protein
MRKIDHAHNAENDRQANAQKRVGRAQHQSINDVLKDLVHLPSPGIGFGLVCDPAEIR